MTSKQKRLIRNSWQKLSTIDEGVLSGMFFDRLFDIAPELRPLCVTPISNLSHKLPFLLGYMVEHMNEPDQVRLLISPLTQYDERAKITRYQFAVVGNALLWTLEHFLNFTWSEEMEDAWSVFFIEVSETIIATQMPQRIRA